MLLAGTVELATTCQPQVRLHTIVCPPAILFYTPDDVKSRVEIRAAMIRRGCIWSYNFRPDQPLSPVQPQHDRVFFSSASLQNLENIQIFADENKMCKGLLLVYRDGAQRALGQCRIGLDTITLCRNPTRLCLRRGNLDKYSILAEVGDEPRGEHSHGSSDVGAEDFQCFELVGCLRFWVEEDRCWFEFGSEAEKRSSGSWEKFGSDYKEQT